MQKKTILYFIGAGLLITGCYYNNEEELYPNQRPCELTNITYTSTVNSIFLNNGCFSCHSGPNPEGNINLQAYANVKTLVDNGKLLGAINHASGFSPMPKGGSKISTCDINRIKAWVDAGALNN